MSRFDPTERRLLQSVRVNHKNFQESLRFPERPVLFTTYKSNPPNNMTAISTGLILTVGKTMIVIYTGILSSLL